MKLTTKTVLFKEMLNKAIKGASNNKMIPLTSLIAIKLQDGVLTMETCDSVNYLYVKEDKIDGDEFYLTITLEQFAKLVSKMTSDDITLSVEDESLTVKGNGTYKIEVPLDEDGKFITFPDPLASVDGEPTKTYTFTRQDIEKILVSAKSSLATKSDIPCYTGYYIGDTIVTTDTYKICNIKKSLVDEPLLISSAMMDLLTLMDDDEISVKVYDDVLVFSTRNCVVYGTILSGIEDFEINAIKSFVDAEFNSSCKVKKDLVLQALDRIALFVGPYDKNSVNIHFTDTGIEFTDLGSNNVDTVEYISVDSFADFMASIDVELLTLQLKSSESDVIEIYFGRDNAIKLVDDDVTKIVALNEAE